MAILKRIEIWLLLLIIGGAVWFVFQTPEEDITKPEASVIAEKKNDDSAPLTKNEGSEIEVSDSQSQPKEPEPSEITESGARFQVHNVKATTDSEGSVVEFTVSGNAGKTLELTAPNVRLVTESGNEIERFFLPFDPPPVLESEKEATAELKYWVRSDVNEALWLEIDGDRVAVDLEKR